MPRSNREVPDNFSTRFFDDETIKKVWAKNDLYSAREAAIEVIQANTGARDESKRKALQLVERASTIGKLFDVCTNMWQATSGNAVIQVNAR